MLVTGATGFLGGEIALEFNRCGYQVTALVRPGSDRSHLSVHGITFLEGDITDPGAVAKAMMGQTYVCHAAALVPGTGASDDEFERVNAGGTKVVCEAAIEAGVSRLIHVSTAHVFGIDPGTSVNEESIPSMPTHPGYDASKLQAERLVLDYAAGPLDAVIVNPAVVFGPRSRHSGRLINLFLRGRLPIIPLPDRVLSLVYSGDVAIGVRMALESSGRGERFILAGPTITIREFITMLGNASGRRPSRYSLPAWTVISAVALAWAAFPISRWRPPVTLSAIRHGGTIYDGSKAIRDLGMKYTPLDVALTNTVQWLADRKR